MLNLYRSLPAGPSSVVGMVFWFIMLAATICTSGWIALLCLVLCALHVIALITVCNLMENHRVEFQDSIHVYWRLRKEIEKERHKELDKP